MLKIGITGVNGFVGSSLYVYLKSHDYDVIGFSRRKNDSNFTYWNISKSPLQSPARIDVLVHCAGTVDDWASYQECYENNCEGTKNALESFPDLQKFIYISSCSVYDTKDHSSLISETSPCGNFLNGYSRSKYEAEQIVLNHNTNSQKIILRPHVIYGEKDKKIMPRLLKSHKFDRFLVLGDGSNLISITHIENLCAAIKDSIESKEKFQKEIFNITDEGGLKINTVITHIKKKFNIESKNLYIPTKVAILVGYVIESLFSFLRIKKAPLITRYIVHQLTSNHVISINKAQKMLKYTPTKSFVDF